ncbi:MAG: integrase [Fluviicola sp. XM-24bin1]|nr:MAG: integrase [Fluviicola sp. XM-24bin1]
MATLNLILDKRRARKDGTYPLVFRIRIGKKFSDIRTEFKLRPQEFDSKTSSIVNDLYSNELLLDLKKHYIQRLRSYMISNVGREDVKEARKYLVNKLPDEVTMHEFWLEQIEELRTAGRQGGARVYQTALSVLSQETNLNRPFSQFSYKDLIQLEKKLYQRGLSNNGISVYMRSFRAICNKAINFDLVDYSWYPFRKYKFKKDKTTPRVLTQEELRRFFRLNLSSDHPFYQSWLLGKLIFMLRGINITDLLLLSSDNLQNGRIIYKRAKTGKVYSIKMTDEVKCTFEKFEANKTLVGLITEKDLKDRQKLVNILIQRRKVINTHLKKIGKLIEANEAITTYVFRYSYANIAKQLGYSKDLIGEALGHNVGSKITGIYLEQFDLEVVDEMNQRIIKSIS